MVEIYWYWYKIALLLEIISIIIAFTQKYSIKAKNFNKVWLHYSLTQWNFIEWNKPWFFSNFFWIISRLLINPFLSWIMVFIRWYWFITLINQKISTPEKLKEIHYKLWASLLNEKEVKKLIKESASFMWKDIVFDDEEENNTLVLESSEDWWYSEISLDIKNEMAYFYSHTPDYDWVYNDTYKYKIEENILYWKLLEKKIENPWKINYEVKDWVILESYIKNEYENNDFLWIFKKYDEKISELQKEIEWNKNYNYKIKYYILSKNDEIIPKNEFRKILRYELERIKLWFIKIVELCKNYDIELIYNEKKWYYEFKYKNDKKNDDINYDDFSEKYESILLEVNCKKNEIENSNEIIETINWYLEEEKID